MMLKWEEDYVIRFFLFLFYEYLLDCHFEVANHWPREEQSEISVVVHIMKNVMENFHSEHLTHLRHTHTHMWSVSDAN